MPNNNSCGCKPKQTSNNSKGACSIKYGGKKAPNKVHVYKQVKPTVVQKKARDFSWVGSGKGCSKPQVYSQKETPVPKKSTPSMKPLGGTKKPNVFQRKDRIAPKKGASNKVCFVAKGGKMSTINGIPQREVMRQFKVEGAESKDGSATSGPFLIGNNDTLRFYSDTLDISVERGSAIVNIENTVGVICDGNDNILSGMDPRASVSGGERNTVYGCGAGPSTLSEDDTVLVGYNAGGSAPSEGVVAIGSEAGQNSELNAVSIGREAGNSGQGTCAVAIGHLAGEIDQDMYSIAIGKEAGTLNQGTNGIAIGKNAGRLDQGDNSIAIGNGAGESNQGDNSIIISADPSITQALADRTYIAPIRVSREASFVRYIPSTGEVTHSTELNLDDITNVDIVGPTGGDYLCFDENTSEWINQSIGINTLNDVAVSGPTGGDYLCFDEITGEWINESINIDTLNDVTISGPTGGDYLCFDEVTGEWINQSIPIDSLNDVTILGPTGGDYICFDEVTGEWINQSIPINSLNDVSIIGPTGGDYLCFDEVTGEWINQSIGIDTLNDVTIIGPTGGEYLCFDETTGEWINQSIGIDILNDITIVGPTGCDYLRYDDTTGEWINDRIYKLDKKIECGTEVCAIASTITFTEDFNTTPKIITKIDSSNADGTTVSITNVTRDYFDYDVTVTSFPNVVVTADSTGDSGKYSSTKRVDGNPAVSYISDGDLVYKRATDTKGETWPGSSITVDTGVVQTSLQTLENTNSDPAIAYFKGSSQVRFKKANDSTGSSWPAVGTHVLIYSDLLGVQSFGISMAIIDGNPAICFHDNKSSRMRYIRSSDADGASWGVPFILDSGGFNLGRNPSLAYINGRPSVVSATGGSGEILRYIRANNSTGQASGDWPSTGIEIVDTTGRILSTSLTAVNGNPAVAFIYNQTGQGGSVRFRRSSTSTGTSAGDWSTEVVISTGTNKGVSLAFVNGYPVIAFYKIAGDMGTFIAKSTDPNGGAGTWTVTKIASNGSMLGIATIDYDLSLLDEGFIGLSYYQDTGDDLEWAISTPIVSFDWKAYVDNGANRLPIISDELVGTIINAEGNIASDIDDFMCLGILVDENCAIFEGTSLVNSQTTDLTIEAGKKYFWDPILNGLTDTKTDYFFGWGINENCIYIEKQEAPGANPNADFALRIGCDAGLIDQGDYAIAIGLDAGGNTQGSDAIAIGNSAGRIGQGDYAIAIGSGAGDTGQHDNSIILNASGTPLVSNGPDRIFIKPMRTKGDTGDSGTVQWDPSTGEVTYNSLKTFVIDHPKDNEKYLVHACLEGPEAGVYYRGTAEIIEGCDRVVIGLPDYVNDLAYDFTVHITPIYNGKPRMCLSAGLVENNKFSVYGEAGPFSWIVHGTRNEINTEPNKYDVLVSGKGPYRYLEYL